MPNTNNIFVRIIRFLFQPFRWFYQLSWFKKLKVITITLLIVITLGIGVLFLGYQMVLDGSFGSIPTEQELKDLKNYQASEVYSSDGVLLGRYYLENRTEIKLEDVSPFLIEALIATEDVRFYEHKGIDQRSLMRVLFKSIILGQRAGGGSTLSQQLVKNIYGRKSYGTLTMPVNKMREAIIANKMEHIYTKEEMLMLYLNTVSFGEDTYGIGTACERFFSTSAKDIEPEKAAVLVGMLKSPTRYNPRNQSERAITRRNVVLHQLAVNSFITEQEKIRLQQKELGLQYNRVTQKSGIATHLREHLRNYLDQWLEEHPKEDGSFYNLYTDGLKIKISIHSKLQQYAEEAVREHLTQLQTILDKDLKRNGVLKRNKKRVMQLLKKTKRYQSLANKKWADEEIIKELSKPLQTTIYTIKGPIDTIISPLDSLQYSIQQLQAGFLVLEPSTGNIQAWVGGASFQQNQFDHVLSKRQVGSVFKPIVYAQALRDGQKPCDFISNQKVTYTAYENWSPKNSGGTYGGKYTMAGALANSVNTVSVKLCMESGINNVISLAREMGVESKLPSVPSLALGVGALSLKELMGVYTAFANNGVRSEPQYVMSIVDKNGKQLFSAKKSSKRVLSVEVSQDITNMMQGVVQHGTANRLRSKYGVQSAVAAKTGTTQQQKDAWFVGYTPKWLGGVWVGADQSFIHFSSARYGQGASAALPIWAKYYQKIAHDKELSNRVKGRFNFSNTIDCETFKEDSFFEKLFKRKNKKNKKRGLDKKKRRK